MRTGRLRPKRAVRTVVFPVWLCQAGGGGIGAAVRAAGSRAAEWVRERFLEARDARQNEVDLGGVQPQDGRCRGSADRQISRMCARLKNVSRAAFRSGNGTKNDLGGSSIRDSSGAGTPPVNSA